MKWDLEERTEDAIVAYLSTRCDGMRVSAAWQRDEREYPCVIVHVASTAPISEPAEWHDARMLAVSVAVMTEGADEIDGDGATVRTARERNALARSQVLDALCTTGLLAGLQEQGVADVAFSMAQVTSTERSVEDRYLVTTIAAEVIAEPVEDS